MINWIKISELYHHGIKGQQWGVRNGPPYPIDDKVLRKGTKLNSVELANKKKHMVGSTHITQTMSMIKRYMKGLFPCINQ